MKPSTGRLSETEPSTARTDTAAVPIPPTIPAEVPRSAHDMAISELHRLLGAWQQYEPGARLGEDAEALHQLRVTARRIDATLGLFKRQLPPALVQARKTTKGVLRSLGAARDLDVQLLELAQYCDGRPEHEQTAAEPLRLRLESERERARARMVRGLDSEATHHWLETLSLAGTERAERGGEPALAVLPERVRRRFRKLRKSVANLRGKSSMDEYHQVRRRAKQLRYALECGGALFGKPGDETLKSLRRLQDRLGAQQDAHMAQSRLATLAADPHNGLPPATLFLMGRLAEQHAQLTARARDTLARSWRKVRGRRWKSLRTRLEQLSQYASAAAAAGAPGGTVSATDPGTASAGEADLRSIKH
jgi:triphosphatase